MCKYCETRICNDRLGEKTNDCATIGTIKDGSQEFDVCMNVYIVESEKIHRSELLLYLFANNRQTTLKLKEKSIKIKYCPFCGREL